MSSFHILRDKMRQMFPETAGTGKDIGSRYMTSKTWISLIRWQRRQLFKVLCGRVLGNRRIAEEAIPQKETDPSFAREEKTENSSAGLSLDGQKTIRVLLETNGFEGQFHENRKLPAQAILPFPGDELFLLPGRRDILSGYIF